MHQEIDNAQTEHSKITDSSIAAKIREQSHEVIKQYHIDFAVLWQAYADRLAQEKLRATGQTFEFFYDDESRADCWGYDDYVLKVFPDDTPECISFAIFDVKDAVFAPPLDRTIVHLSLPFASPDAPVSECTLNDQIYWISGNQVVAAGVIDLVLYNDIIIGTGGLLVPVVVKPFICRFKPFAVADAIDEDHQDAYAAFVADRDSMDSKLKDISPAYLQDHAKTPRIAVEIDRLLGHDLLIYIDDRSSEPEARDDAGN
jgi:hypothetical protein